jgi:hypothetical protein
MVATDFRRNATVREVQFIPHHDWTKGLSRSSTRGALAVTAVGPMNHVPGLKVPAKRADSASPRDPFTNGEPVRRCTRSSPKPSLGVA